MEREQVDTWCERGIFVLVLAVLVFGALATGGVRPFEFSVMQFLTVAVLLLWAIRFCINPEHRFFWPPLSWIVLLFVLYTVGLYFKADIEYVARQELCRVLMYASLYFAVLHNLHRQEATKWAALLLVFVGLGVAGYGIYQFLTKSDHVWHFIRPDYYAGRASGTYICPNHFAGFLELIFPLGLGLVLVGRLPQVLKIILIYAVLVMLAGIALSFSRGGWMGAAMALLTVGGLLFFAKGFRWRALALILGFLLAGGFFVTQTSFGKKRLEETATNNDSKSVRVEIWKAAQQMWFQNKGWGVGPGHFDYRFRQFRSPQVQGRPERVHNDFLNALTDYGAVGAFIMAAGCVVFLAGVIKTWPFVQRSRDIGTNKTNKFALVVGGLGAGAALFMHSFVDFNLQIPANAALAVFLVALVTVHLRFATEDYWRTPRAWERIAAVVIIGGVAVVLGAWGVKRFQENAWIQQAAHVKDPLGKIKFLEKSTEIETSNPEVAYEIGELYRLISVHGDDYKPTAEKAITWFQRALRLNPYDSYSLMKWGMTLDLLGRREEAGELFARALPLDPNGYYMLAMQGWHRMQLRDFKGALPWLEKSYNIYPNTIAAGYLRIVRNELASPEPSFEERARRELLGK